MAKKKDEFDFGPEFDNFESEFDGFGYPGSDTADSAKNRKPVEKVKQGASSFFKEAGKSIGPKLATNIAQKLPDTARLVGDATRFTSDTMAMRDQFVRDIQPSINQLKRAGRMLAPKFKGYIPDKLQQKLDKFLAEAEDWKSPSAEEARSTAINDQLATIFAVQEKREQQKTEDERSERFMEKTISATRHKELSQQVDAIRIATEFQKDFTQTIGTAYMKKSLELKYKHLFVAQDTLAVTQGIAKLLEGKLEEIRHNTSLPDIQKQQLSESYKEVARAAIAQRLNSKFANWGQNILQNIQTSILDPAKEILNMTASGLDIYASVSSSFDDIPGMSESVEQQAGGWLGGLLGGKIAGKIGNKLLGNQFTRGLLSPYGANLEKFAESAKFKLMLKAQELADAANSGEDNSMLSGLWQLLSPNLRKGGGSIKAMFTDPFEPAQYDNATRTSIVEIIPGYLAKILQQITQLSTGKKAEELTFDLKSRDFVSVSEWRQNVLTESFGTREDKGTKLGGAVGALRGSFSHVNENTPSFDAQMKGITQVLINAANVPTIIYPERIKAYLENSYQEDYTKSRYISMLFKGVENPKDVATILVSSLYRLDDQVNQQAVIEVNRYVQELAMEDSYLETLPKYLTGMGQSRHLSDIAKSTGSSFSIDKEYTKNRWWDADEKKFTESVNYSGTSTKEYLDRDVTDKLDSEDWVRNLLDPLFGRALNTDKKSNLSTVIRSQFDDFFKKMYLANVLNEGVVTPFASSSESPIFSPGLTSSTNLIPTQRERKFGASIKHLPGRDLKEGGVSKEILAGTEIVLPVHIQSSAIKLAADVKVEEKQKSATTSSPMPIPTIKVTGLENLLKDHADRQHPVPDLLQGMNVNLGEINDKLLSILTSMGSVFGKLYHKGKSLGSAALSQVFKLKTVVPELARKGHGALKKGIDWTKDFLGDSPLGGLKNFALGAGDALKNTGLTALVAMMMAGEGIAGMGKSGWDSLKGLKDKIPGIPEKVAQMYQRKKAAFKAYKEKVKDKLSLTYVDIYLKDKVEPGKPLLSKRKQRDGVVFSDGSKVRTSFRIDKPVLDPETGETYITQDDLDHGLVDVNNQSLSLIAGAKSFLGKTKDKMFGMFGGIGAKFQSIKDFFSMENPWMGALAKLTGGMGSIMGMFGQAGKFGLDWLTGKTNRTIRRKDLQEVVGDKLIEILDYLKSRFGSSEPLGDKPKASRPGDIDGDGQRDSNYEEMLKEQAEKEAAANEKREETQLALLEDIRNATVQEAENSEEAAKEKKGGLIDGLLNMLGMGKLGKYGSMALGMLKNGGSALLGMTGLGGMLSGAGTAIASGVGAIGSSIASGIGAVGGMISGAGGLGAILASNPVGWAIAGAVGVGGAAYLGYKHFNPTADGLTSQRAEYYGVDLETSTSLFSSNYTKRVYELEEVTAEILEGKESPFDDKDLMYWAEQFGFDPKDKEQVKYWTLWYRQRFFPVFQIFMDLIKKAGYTYDNIDDIPEKDVAVISKEFAKQTSGHLQAYKNLVPTMAGYKEFQKTYAETSKEMESGVTSTTAEEAANIKMDKGIADVATSRSTQKYDTAASLAVQRMAAPSPATSTAGALAAGAGATSVGSEGFGGNVQPVDVSGYKPDKIDSNELGALSAKYESSTKGSIAVGYDAVGGTSYGKYQISSAKGTFNRFLSWLYKQGPEAREVADRLALAGPANTFSRAGAVPEEWKRLVMEGKMKDYEHRFIKESHYDIALAGIKDPELLALIQSSKAIQDVLWSTAVQHGPSGASSIFNAAWGPLTNKTPEDFIKAVYTIRSGKFPSSSQAVQASVRKRFGSEAATALAMLSKDKTSMQSAMSPEMAKDAGTDTAAAPMAAATEPPVSGPAPTGPKISTGEGSPGMDMAPTAMPTTAPGVTKPQETVAAPASPTPTSAPTPTAPAAPSTTSVDSSAVTVLQKINEGISQTNLHLQALLVGNGTLVEIRDNLSGLLTAGADTTLKKGPDMSQNTWSRSARPKSPERKPPVIDVSRQRLAASV